MFYRYIKIKSLQKYKKNVNVLSQFLKSTKLVIRLLTIK